MSAVRLRVEAIAEFADEAADQMFEIDMACDCLHRRASGAVTDVDADAFALDIKSATLTVLRLLRVIRDEANGALKDAQSTPDVKG